MITYYLGRKYVRADLPMARSNVTRERRGRARHADDDTLVKWAEQSLSRPDSFMYHGGYDLFRTWGMTPVVQTRDSDALEESNYARIFEDMRKTFPDEDMGFNMLEWIGDFRSSHWAYGWAEQILVRVLYDPGEDITPSNITGAFRMIMEIADFLANDYPVYDESDYSEREYKQARDYFDSEWSSVLSHWDEEDDGPEPSQDEGEQVWDHYELYYPDNGAWHETLAGYVRELRAERIKATRAAVLRLLKG